MMMMMMLMLMLMMLLMMMMLILQSAEAGVPTFFAWVLGEAAAPPALLGRQRRRGNPGPWLAAAPPVLPGRRHRQGISSSCMGGSPAAALMPHATAPAWPLGRRAGVTRSATTPPLSSSCSSYRRNNYITGPLLQAQSSTACSMPCTRPKWGRCIRRSVASPQPWNAGL